MTQTATNIDPYITAAKRELTEGKDISKLFSGVRDTISRAVEGVANRYAKTGAVVPELSFDSVKNGSVSQDSIRQIKQHGCVIIRNVFSTQQAQDWNDELGDYLNRNNYLEHAREKAGIDNYFGDLKDAKPQIYGVYWSKPQVMARQAESMAITKRFLNALWDVDAPAGPEFDPDFDYAYADRTRRRAPGDTTLGLSPHMERCKSCLLPTPSAMSCCELCSPMSLRMNFVWQNRDVPWALIINGTLILRQALFRYRQWHQVTRSGGTLMWYTLLAMNIMVRTMPVSSTSAPVQPARRTGPMHYGKHKVS